MKKLLKLTKMKIVNGVYFVFGDIESMHALK